MSKNITIDIGGNAQNFPNVESVILNNIGDGQSEFLSNEDFIKKKSSVVQDSIVVFTEDGDIDTSNISVSDISSAYIFIYDESKEHNSYNKEQYLKMRAALEQGKKVNVFLNDGLHTCPASYFVGSSYIEITTELFNTSMYMKIQDSNNVVYKQTDTVNTASFAELSLIPASQASTANWVKQLIDDTIVEGAW